MPVNPDTRVYVVALLLAVASGFLFGAVPVRQVLHMNPYEVVKSGSLARIGRRLTIRDALLVMQIAICAVLVTASLVAVRGLARTLHSDFGFDSRQTMLVDVNLSMAGYAADRQPVMERRVLDALGAIPGVQSAGLVDRPPFDEGYNGFFGVRGLRDRSEADQCPGGRDRVHRLSRVFRCGAHSVRGRAQSVVA